MKLNNKESLILWTTNSKLIFFKSHIEKQRTVEDLKICLKAILLTHLEQQQKHSFTNCFFFHST